MVFRRVKPDTLLSSSPPLQQYDSINNNNNTSSVIDGSQSNNDNDDDDETSPLFASLEDVYSSNNNDDNNNNNNGAMMMLPSSRRHRRGKKAVLVLFGLALLAGVLLILLSSSNNSEWHTTYSYDYDSGNNDDDDDYDYDYKYNSWTERIWQVPLLGSSHHKHKAQRHADEAKDYLYLDAKHAKHHKHHRHHKEKDLLGSANEKYLKAPDGCEGTVIIIRHCEKGDIREHCNYIGYERSVYFASLFGHHATERYPAPSLLIAEAPGDRRNPKKKNFRELETLLPLAEKFNLTIDTSFSTLDMHKFTRHLNGLFRSGKMCGKLVIIAWKHSKIPRVATALGCGPAEGCPMDYPRDEYDQLVQIKFVYGKTFHSEHKHLKPPKHRVWRVFGSVHQQHFDSLAFSKQVGDYPPGGTSHGARWRKFDHEIPERVIFDKKKHKKLSKKQLRKWTKWYKESN